MVDLNVSDYTNLMYLGSDKITFEPTIEIGGGVGSESTGSKNVTLELYLDDEYSTIVTTDSGVYPTIEVSITNCYPLIEWFTETMPLNYTLMSGTHIL